MKKYETPEIEVLELETEDIVTESGPIDWGGPGV